MHQQESEDPGLPDFQALSQLCRVPPGSEMLTGMCPSMGSFRTMLLLRTPLSMWTSAGHRAVKILGCTPLKLRFREED